jgi:uncharacterized protein YndB with AHSA1/START domain
VTDSSDDRLALSVRRRIEAPAERLFSYWTDPAHLTQWWGPTGVTCDSAAVDLRVGGAYRIANRFPDGTVLWISGTFEAIEPPRTLVYTWRVGAPDSAATARAALERVTVTFTPVGDATEVVIVHERIAGRDARDGHARGWDECLARLAAFASASSRVRGSDSAASR